MTQNLDNHQHRPTLTFVAALAILGAIACVVMSWLGWNTIGSAVSCLIVVAVVYVLTSRSYTTTLQDRIIRMEMLYRTDRILSPAQREAYATLSIPQIVALRFASDAELPALVDRAGAERLPPREIKRAIKDWQPDFART
jgi:hypothetical protein